MTDLSLVPTDALVDEIVRRHDAVVLTGVKFVNANNGQYITFRKFSGNRFICSGLISVCNTMLADEELASTIPIAKNEDR